MVRKKGIFIFLFKTNYIFNLVGRRDASGDLVPGKIVPSHGCAYIASGGVESSHSEYEYLVRPSSGSLEWIVATDGEIPDAAICGGYTSFHDELFVGRAFYNGSWVIGKVQKSHPLLYIPFGGLEVPLNDYELLICHQWMTFRIAITQVWNKQLIFYFIKTIYSGWT